MQEINEAFATLEAVTAEIRQQMSEARRAASRAARANEADAPLHLAPRGSRGEISLPPMPGDSVASSLERHAQASRAFHETMDGRRFAAPPPPSHARASGHDPSSTRLLLLPGPNSGGHSRHSSGVPPGSAGASGRPRAPDPAGASAALLAASTTSSIPSALAPGARLRAELLGSLSYLRSCREASEAARARADKECRARGFQLASSTALASARGEALLRAQTAVREAEAAQLQLSDLLRAMLRHAGVDVASDGRVLAPEDLAKAAGGAARSGAAAARGGVPPTADESVDGAFFAVPARSLGRPEVRVEEVSADGSEGGWARSAAGGAEGVGVRSVPGGVEGVGARSGADGTIDGIAAARRSTDARDRGSPAVPAPSTVEQISSLAAATRHATVSPDVAAAEGAWRERTPEEAPVAFAASSRPASAQAGAERSTPSRTEPSFSPSEALGRSPSGAAATSTFRAPSAALPSPETAPPGFTRVYANTIVGNPLAEVEDATGDRAPLLAAEDSPGWRGLSEAAQRDAGEGDREGRGSTRRARPRGEGRPRSRSSSLAASLRASLVGSLVGSQAPSPAQVAAPSTSFSNPLSELPAHPRNLPRQRFAVDPERSEQGIAAAPLERVPERRAEPEPTGARFEEGVREGGHRASAGARAHGERVLAESRADGERILTDSRADGERVPGDSWTEGARAEAEAISDAKHASGGPGAARDALTVDVSAAQDAPAEAGPATGTSSGSDPSPRLDLSAERGLNGYSSPSAGYPSPDAAGAAGTGGAGSAATAKAHGASPNLREGEEVLRERERAAEEEFWREQMQWGEQGQRQGTGQAQASGRTSARGSAAPSPAARGLGEVDPRPSDSLNESSSGLLSGGDLASPLDLTSPLNLASPGGRPRSFKDAFQRPFEAPQGGRKGASPSRAAAALLRAVHERQGGETPGELAEREGRDGEGDDGVADAGAAAAGGRRALATAAAAAASAPTPPEPSLLPYASPSRLPSASASASRAPSASASAVGSRIPSATSSRIPSASLSRRESSGSAAGSLPRALSGIPTASRQADGTLRDPSRARGARPRSGGQVGSGSVAASSGRVSAPGSAYQSPYAARVLMHRDVLASKSASHGKPRKDALLAGHRGGPSDAGGEDDEGSGDLDEVAPRAADAIPAHRPHSGSAASRPPVRRGAVASPVRRGKLAEANSALVDYAPPVDDATMDQIMAARIRAHEARTRAAVRRGAFKA